MCPKIQDRETLPTRLLKLRDSDNYCTELVTTEGVYSAFSLFRNNFSEFLALI